MVTVKEKKQMKNEEGVGRKRQCPQTNAWGYFGLKFQSIRQL
jgi:hypothetical protein